MDIRDYQAGDEKAIAALFSETFGPEISSAWWSWRYLDNPIDRPRIKLAWDGGILAAHYAVSPMKLLVNGQPALAALSMGTMTHPAYKGRGLFPRVAESLYGDLQRDGYFGVFGFPNTNSHRTFLEKLGWSDIAAQHTLTLSLADRAAGQDANYRYDSSLVGLNDPVLWMPREDEAFQVAWSPDYAAWRIAQPSTEYHALRALTPGEDRAAAAVVWKYYAQSSVDIVHFGFNQPQALAAVLQALCVRVVQDGRLRVQAWVSLHDRAHRVFEQVGFSASGPSTLFGGRQFGPGSRAFQGKAWQLSMLTSDVY